MSDLLTNTTKRLLQPGLLVAADIVLFKISWVLLVVLQGRAVPGVACLLILRLGLAEHRVRRCLEAGVVFAAGVAMDAAMSLTGLYRFGDAVLPLWLVVLWLSFALVLPHGTAFLGRQHPGVLVLAGALTGMLSYFAGYLLGGITFGLPLWQAMALTGAAWGLYLPAIIALLGRIHNENQKP